MPGRSGYLVKSLLLIILVIASYPSFPHATATSGNQIVLPFATAWAYRNPHGTSSCTGCNQVYSKSQNFYGSNGNGNPTLQNVTQSQYGYKIWPGAYGFSGQGDGNTPSLGAFGYFGGSRSYGELRLFDSVSDYATPFRIENHTHISIWYLHFTSAGTNTMIDALLYNQATGQYAMLGDFNSIVDQNGYRMHAAYRGNDPVGSWAHAVFNLDPVFKSSPWNWFVLLILVRWDNSQSGALGAATTFFGDMRWTYSTAFVKKAVSPYSQIIGTLFYLVTAEVWAQSPDVNDITKTDLSLKVTVTGYSKATYNQSSGCGCIRNMYPQSFSVGATSSGSTISFPQPDDITNWSPTGANLTQEVTTTLPPNEYLLDAADMIVEAAITYAIPELGGPLLIAHIAADFLKVLSSPGGGTSYLWPEVNDTYMVTGSTLRENDAHGEVFLTAKGVSPTYGMTLTLTPSWFYAITLFGADVTKYQDSAPLSVSWSATPYSPSGTPSYDSTCVIPNDAGSGGDAGKSFSAATPIALGTYTGCLNPGEDWYKFYAAYGYSITVAVTPPAGSTFRLELYTPSGAFFAYYDPMPGGQGSALGTYACPGGNWTIRISADMGQGNYTFSVHTSAGDYCGGGGGGSIMAGTQVLMSDGSSKLVQNLADGMVIRSFDPATNSFYNATITSVAAKSVNNLYVTSTSNGNPIRTDYYENFWVQLPSGAQQWMHAGQVQLGYKILRPTDGTWATITSIETDTGTYTVYDLIITPTLTGGPMPVIANGYLDMKT